MNAFHPDYIKTYHADFMKSYRTHEANRQAAETLSGYVSHRRKSKPSYGTVYGISDKVTPQPAASHLHRPRQDMLKIKVFHTYAKAHANK
jgi:hypothetical protein